MGDGLDDDEFDAVDGDAGEEGLNRLAAEGCVVVVVVAAAAAVGFVHEGLCEVAPPPLPILCPLETLDALLLLLIPLVLPRPAALTPLLIDAMEDAATGIEVIEEDLE